MRPDQKSVLIRKEMIIEPSLSQAVRPPQPSGPALLSLGFRPFFLLAGIAAVVLMAIWLLGYTKRDPLLTYYGSSGMRTRCCLVMWWR